MFQKFYGKFIQTSFIFKYDLFQHFSLFYFADKIFAPFSFFPHLFNPLQVSDIFYCLIMCVKWRNKSVSVHSITHLQYKQFYIKEYV